MKRIRQFFAVTGLGVCVLTSGGIVGPKYQRATAPVPAKWDVAEPWRESAPKDGVAKGEWWSVFHDDDLSAMEKQALDANQTIKIAAARLDQARALAAVQVATQFPTLATTPNTQRQRLSGNRPASSNFPVRSPVSQTNNVLPFTVGYEVDLFGRRRRSIEAAQASYQASAADLENVRLVITAELAGDYFTLRQLDTELGILNRTVETLQKKQFEDAIAVLIGKPAPDFHLSPQELKDVPPALDAGLPSDLLERRPDVAEAERQMAVANAQIGIARAAYYPSLNLFGNGGWQAADIAKLMNVQSTFWAVGANVAESIFTGGSRRAQVQFAKAGYDASVAGYRDSVLNAFREVQDDVTGLTVLDQANQSQQQAVDSARRTLDIAIGRYTGGLVNYLDVVNAQQNLLNNEQELAVIHGQRLVTSVLLIKALGGGWDASSLSAVHVKTKLKDVVAP